MESLSKVKQDLTLMLLYLNSWEENGFYPVKRSWKGYDFGDLDSLIEQEFIDGKRSSKSVYFSEKGVEEAERLLREYKLL